MNLDVSFNCGRMCCGECRGKHKWSFKNSDLHPIWYKNNEPQLYIPTELSDLREGEKLLIQMVSVYIPLYHLKYGMTGVQGHVCSFPQDIKTICYILPRLPSDVQIVKIVRKFKSANNETGSKTFSIRKDKVLNALKWLQKYNIQYKHIQIDENNLNWMGNSE